MRARLELMVQVARAASYAHGRLVVHRDLKPSNVLVTPDGHIHLLDFGIAKLLHEATAGEIGLTQEQGRVLTPHFASPEQIRGEAITVQSDVYSLGVLTFDLLTGSTPYEPKRNTLGALEEAILEGEPALASSRAADKTTAKALRGEVDAILAKALRREPDKRYATADAFASDIERHLAGERVLAQPDRWHFRLRRGFNRHRVAYLSSAAAAVALVCATAISVTQARRASEEALRTQLANDFFVDIFKTKSADPEDNFETRQVPAEVLLARGAALIESKFSGQEDLRERLYDAVSSIFLDMGNAKKAEYYARQGISTVPGDNPDSNKLAQKRLLLAQALRMQERFNEAEDQVLAVVKLSDLNPRLLALGHLEMAELLVTKSSFDAAERELALVETVLTALAPRPSIELARYQNDMSVILDHKNLNLRAIEMDKQAIDTAARAEGETSPFATQVEIRLGTLMIDLARTNEGRKYLNAAYKGMRMRRGADDLQAARSEANKTAYMFDETTDHGRRQISFDEAHTIVDTLFSQVSNPAARVPPSTKADVAFDRGWVYASYGQVAKGYEMMKEAFKELGPLKSDRIRLQRLTVMGEYAMKVGDASEANTLLRDAVMLGDRYDGVRSAYSAQRRYFLAENLRMSGKLIEAAAELDEIATPIDVLVGSAGDPRAYTEWGAVGKIEILIDRGDSKGALALIKSLKATANNSFMEAELLRGIALCHSGDAKAGLDLMEDYTAKAAVQRDENDPGVARLRALAGECALKSGRSDRAVVLANAARAAFVRQPGVNRYYKLAWERLDRDLGHHKASDRSAGSHGAKVG